MNHSAQATEQPTPQSRPDPDTDSPEVLRLADFTGDLEGLLAAWGLELLHADDDQNIEGSYWGDDEAGLVDNRVIARPDTPIHSVLHEACHWICMDQRRRTGLHTDAGGGYDEENGVCYLQVLLARELEGMGEKRMFADMDAWGYSFRLGSAQAWFEGDAEDALEWLQGHGIVDEKGRPTKRPRDGS